MSTGERTLKNSISQRITLAPKREGGCCAFKKCCEKKCLNEIKRVRTHPRTREEIQKRVSLGIEKINLLAESEDGRNFETQDRLAARLSLIIRGATVPIDYGGMMDYSFCGEHFPIQTYSIEEMREILRPVPLEVGIKSAYVSVLGTERPTGLSEPFSELLAWIAAVRGENGEHLERLMRNGGVNGVRAIARIAGEPAIDERTRKKFMVASCILASCISIRDGKAHANNEELAEGISRFSTFESYVFTSSGAARRRERGGMPCPLPNIDPQPHMMKQMARVCIEGLFQANMDIANRIDSIINSGDEEIEENSERLSGMHESLKMGLRFLLDGNTVSSKSLEILVDGKMLELYGPITTETPQSKVNGRMAGMDYGEQNIIRHSISKIMGLDAGSIMQINRILGTSSSYSGEVAEKIRKYLSA